MYMWLYGILGSGENYPELALTAAPRARSRCVPLPLLTIAPALPERQWYWCQGAAAAALRASGALCPGWGEFAGIWHHVECTEHGEMLKLGHQLAALCLACSFLPCVPLMQLCVVLGLVERVLRDVGCSRSQSHAGSSLWCPVATHAWMWNFPFL